MGQASQQKCKVAVISLSVHASIQMHVHRPTRFACGWKVDLEPPGTSVKWKSFADECEHLHWLPLWLLHGKTALCEQTREPQESNTLVTSKTMAFLHTALHGSWHFYTLHTTLKCLAGQQTLGREDSDVHWQAHQGKEAVPVWSRAIILSKPWSRERWVQERTLPVATLCQNPYSETLCSLAMIIFQGHRNEWLSGFSRAFLQLVM